MTTQQLAGKWALVTGSSRGIGQQIAMGLAERGCNVVIHGRSLSNTEATQKLLADYDVQTHVTTGDLATDEGIQAIIAGVVAGPGTVDILYNNAAIMSPYTPIFETYHGRCGCKPCKSTCLP